MRTVPFDQMFAPANGLQAKFTRAGHIVGSACVALNIDGTRLTFSGDVGRPVDPIMKPAATLSETDYLVIESTYGDRRHPQEDAAELLAGIVNRTAEQGAVVLIPAFAVGRAQHLLHILDVLKKARKIAEIAQAQALSAHADYAELCAWLAASKLSPRRVFVSHGEPTASDALCRRLRDTFGWDCVGPDDRAAYTLS